MNRKELENMAVFFKENFPRNVGLYARLSLGQRDAINAYFKFRTKMLFSLRYPRVKLRISASKMESILNLTCGATDWYFDGIIDTGGLGSHCALGHALRYEYYAYSPSVKRSIIFGSKCAGDFFDISPEILSSMGDIRLVVLDEIKELLYLHYTKKESVAITTVINRTVRRRGVKPAVGTLLTMCESNCVADYIKGKVGSHGLNVLSMWRNIDLMLPNLFVRLILEGYANEVFNCSKAIELNSQEKIVSLFSGKEQCIVKELIDSKERQPRNNMEYLLHTILTDKLGIVSNTYSPEDFKSVIDDCIKILRDNARLLVILDFYRGLTFPDGNSAVITYINTNTMKAASFDEIKRDKYREKGVKRCRNFVCSPGVDILFDFLEWLLKSSRLHYPSSTALKKSVGLTDSCSEYRVLLRGKDMLTSIPLLTKNYVLDDAKSNLSIVSEILALNREGVKEVVEDSTCSDCVPFKGTEFSTTSDVSDDTMWGYMLENIKVIPNDAVKSIVLKHSCATASEKQIKFVRDVFKKMVK